jgi:hypothetical protein
MRSARMAAELHSGNASCRGMPSFPPHHSHGLQVASDIEDPYNDDPNELPLPQMQYKLNERLLAVSHTIRPVAFTDFGEIAGPGNQIQFSSFMHVRSTSQPAHRGGSVCYSAASKIKSVPHNGRMLGVLKEGGI